MSSKPSWFISLIPLLFLIAELVCVIRFFGSNALDGASQTALLAAAGLAAAISMLAYKISWKELEDGIIGNIKTIASSIIILLLIGAVSGTWMISGVVPTLIYYGLEIISPKIFLFTVCVVCALVSVLTGSSWTTIATLGVAFMGIGMAQGYSAGWTAGAIISGAYFGDKISPLSDTTVLASSSAEVPIFEHIRYMMITTVPTFTIACIVFLAVSLLHPASESVHAAEYSEAIKNGFHISLWILIVPVLTGVLIAKRAPAMVTLFLAAMMAAIAALAAQPDIVAGIGGGECLTFRSGFSGTFRIIFGDTAVYTGNEAVNELVQTSGITGMLPTVFLIFCAAAFGGTMTGSGMLQSITEAITRHISGRTAVVGSTVGTGILCNLTTGDQYLSIILTGSLFKQIYRKNGFEGRLMSRSMEDSATVTSVLIPWNSCGMTQSSVLRVPTLDYAPYCIFNLLSPVMSIIIAALGYKIVRTAKGVKN